MTPTRIDARSWLEVERALASAAGATCFVCSRAPAPKGLTFKGMACCAGCAPIAMQATMIDDLTEAESEALRAGGDDGGAYLDSIGKTDLAELAEDEWLAFLAKILVGYSTAMRRTADATPPF